MGCAAGALARCPGQIWGATGVGRRGSGRHQRAQWRKTVNQHAGRYAVLGALLRELCLHARMRRYGDFRSPMNTAPSIVSNAHESGLPEVAAPSSRQSIPWLRSHALTWAGLVTLPLHWSPTQWRRSRRRRTQCVCCSSHQRTGCGSQVSCQTRGGRMPCQLYAPCHILLSTQRECERCK